MADEATRVTGKSSTERGTYLTAWVPISLIEGLTERAWRLGVSRSSLVRKLLEAGVKDTTP